VPFDESGEILTAAPKQQDSWPKQHRVLVNGTPGLLVAPHSEVQFVMAFTVTDGRILAIESLADPERLARPDAHDFIGRESGDLEHNPLP